MTPTLKKQLKTLAIVVMVMAAIPVLYFLAMGGMYIILYDTSVSYSVEFDVLEYDKSQMEKGLRRFGKNSHVEVSFRGYSMRENDITVDIAGARFSGLGSNSFADEQFRFHLSPARLPLFRPSDDEMIELSKSLFNSIDAVDGQTIVRAKIERITFDQPVNPSESQREIVFEMPALTAEN